ncbi:MAG: Crp/Fnr family transcriptional regulator [Polyangiaceae bacterium]
MTTRKFMEFLSAGRWFGGLCAEFREALSAAAVSRTLVPGERLFSRGDAPSGIYAVVEGGVRITATAESGKELLFAVVEPPMWFGEISVFDRKPRTHDAIAAEKTTLVHVSQEDLEAILARTPTWWRELATLATWKLRLTFLAVEDGALPLAERLARRLVLAAESYGEWKDRSNREVDLKQEQLAAMTGTSRQTVNQALKELESKGLVRLAYGKIAIVDLDGLRRLAS